MHNYCTLQLTGPIADISAHGSFMFLTRVDISASQRVQIGGHNQTATQSSQGEIFLKLFCYKLHLIVFYKENTAAVEVVKFIVGKHCYLPKK